jgi:hypothetical protein
MATENPIGSLNPSAWLITAAVNVLFMSICWYQKQPGPQDLIHLPTLLLCLLNLNEWGMHRKVTKIAPVNIATSVYSTQEPLSGHNCGDVLNSVDVSEFWIQLDISNSHSRAELHVFSLLLSHHSYFLVLSTSFPSFVTPPASFKNSSLVYITQGVPGGKVNILGGHNIGHRKQNQCICKVKFSLYRPCRPLGLREVEAPTFSDIRLINGGKFASSTRRALFTPRKILGTHFC